LKAGSRLGGVNGGYGYIEGEIIKRLTNGV